MNLKEELEKIEEEEREQKVENSEQLRKWGIDDKIKGLYQRVNVIIEYITREEEKATPEEEELWDCGYSEGYEDGVNSVMNDNKKEIEAIEKTLGIPVPSQNLTSLSHAIQNFMGNEPRKGEARKEGTSSEYSKGYADGVKNLAKKMSDDIDKSVENKKELLEKLEKILSIQMPPFADIATIMSQIQMAIAQQEQAIAKETAEEVGEPGEQREEKEPDETKRTTHVFGLGRKIGDV